MKYLYVANWKMKMSFKNGINFCTNNHASLQKLGHNADIVLCPSFISITTITDFTKNSAIAIGAQDCCEYAQGAYTGEISAASLQEIGVIYCIVGHSERRIYYHETSDSIIKKIELLCAHNIQPIICIGETKQDYENKKTYEVLTKQIEAIISEMEQHDKQIIIAYEPVWSIGTGIIPEAAILQSTFSWLTKYMNSTLPNNPIKLLYGGSVNSDNISQLKNIKHIDGFLIGTASTEYEEFEKIVMSK